jgi:O-antigen ligase
MMAVSKSENKLSEILVTVVTVGLFLTMAFTTLAFGTVDPWSVMVFGFSIITLFLLWAVGCFVDRKATFNLPATALPLLAVLIYAGLQSIGITDGAGKRWSISMDVESTRLALEVACCLFIAFLLAANLFTNRERLTWLRNFLIFFGLALAIFGLIQHFTWNGKLYWFVDGTVPSATSFGPFVNHNHFAGYLEMIAPIPVALILTRAIRGELALLYGFAAALMGIATIVSLSRGGMISLISGLMFVVIFGLRKSMLSQETSSSVRFPLFLSRVAAAAVIIITLGAGVWWIGADSVIKRVEKTELSTDERSKLSGKETVFQSRGWIWRDTIAMIRSNWVTGVGFGAYYTAYPIYSERDGRLIVRQAHNDYLQILADCGVVGAVAALSFIILVFRDILRALRHPDRKMAALALGCGAGVFAMLVHSLFDFNLQLPSNALLFLVLTAVISNISWAAVRNRVDNASFERSSRPRGISRELEVWS